jgi:hypothetical protein
MIVSKYSLSNSSEWDNLIDNSLNGTFILKRKYLEYHKDRFVEYSAVVTKDEEVVGIFPGNVDENNNIVSYGGLTYGSLVVDKKLKPLEILNCFKQLLIFYNKLGFKKINYKSVPLFYYSKISMFESYILFLVNAKLNRMDISSVINLNNDIVFDQRKKRAIKKAEKNNLKIIKNEFLETFWDEILSVNLKEKHQVKPVHSFKEIKYLQSSFPENIFFYGVLFEDRLIAGSVIYINNKVAHAQYIAASELGKKLGALDFLFSELIFNELKWVEYFSLGISNQNNGKILNKGLFNWKFGFGSESFQNNFHSIETSNFSLIENII